MVNFDDSNVNDIINMMKGLSLYEIKSPELNFLLFKAISENIETFSIK